MDQVKITVIDFKISLKEAIAYLRKNNADRSIQDCHKYINELLNSSKIISNLSIEYVTITTIFNCNIEELSQNKILRESIEEELSEIKKAQQWYNNLNSFEKGYVQLLIRNSMPSAL